jgi:hypothetical protein
LTKHRLRWEKNGWNRSDGNPVENADLIRQICPLVDERHIGFWKIKGHSKDPWNNLADSLAVKGRNVQSKEVVVQILFRVVRKGQECFEAIPRISVSSHANIYDFWPALVDKFGRDIGEPEDHEIWQGHTPLRGPLVHGLTYEIVSRFTPGRPRPQAARRNSIDLTTAPTSRPSISVQAPKSKEVPQAPRALYAPAHGVPPQWSAIVTYQPQDAPEKEWRGWFTGDDTEYSLERRARKELGMFGCWRRAAYWRDAEGIRLVMTNKRKQTTLRYLLDKETDPKEITIFEDDTPGTILARLKPGTNFFITDENKNVFASNDSLFGYCTFAVNPPVKVLHQSALRSLKPRALTKKKDNRMAVEIHLGDGSTTFARGAHKTYAKLLNSAKEFFGTDAPVHALHVRAEDDRIILECSTEVLAPWFTEKACPPLNPEDDRLLQEASNVGGWGTNPPPVHPMKTRSQKASAEKKRNVIVWDREKDTRTKIGEASHNYDAMDMAKASGLAPPKFNWTIVEETEDDYVLTFSKGELYSGLDPGQKHISIPKT